MTLRIILKNAVHGYWDGGAKAVFNWELDGKPKQDKQGFFVKVGSWEANQWLNIGCGKNKIQGERQILANLKTKLLKTLAKRDIAVENAIIF